MPTEVRLHPAAERELRTAYLWYLERNPTVAASFIAEVDHAIGVIAESPGRWPRLSKSARRYVFPRFPFSLVYRVKTDCLEVLAVAHQKKRPGYWQARQQTATQPVGASDRGTPARFPIFITLGAAAQFDMPVKKIARDDS